MRQAVVDRSEGILGALLIEVACLVHPSDRDVAGWQPALLGLDAWERVGQGWGDGVRAFVSAQIQARSASTPTQDTLGEE